MHLGRIVAFDEVWRVPDAYEKGGQLVARNARQHRRPGDLVTIEMQDRQHGAVALGIQELVRVPTRCQRPGLGLAIADHACDDEIRVVECRAIRMRQRIAQFAAFVNRPGRFGGDVTGDAARKRKLLEQPVHSLLVLRYIGIDLAVGSLEVGVRDERRPAVTGPGDEKHRQIVGDDDAV